MAKLVKESLNENDSIHTKKLKKKIDEMSYREMLDAWRFASLGDPLFQGEIGSYFSKVMQEKKKKLSHEQQVNISKNIGWEK